VRPGRPPGSAAGRRLGPHGGRPREPIAPGFGARQARRTDLRTADPPGPRPDRGTDRLAVHQRRARPVRDGDPPGLRRRDAPTEAPRAGPPAQAGEGRPRRDLLRDRAEATREGPGRGGGADPGLRHALSAGRPAGSIDGEHDDQHVVRGAEQRDGSASELAEASQDLRVLEGPGDAPGGLLFHRVQLQLLLAGADAAGPGGRGPLAGPDPGDGGGLE
jgi:hypothetical protein